jgi:inosine-uridine nucleoside N-ribohydrolase
MVEMLSICDGVEIPFAHQVMFHDWQVFVVSLNIFSRTHTNKTNSANPDAYCPPSAQFAEESNFVPTASLTELFYAFYR